MNPKKLLIYTLAAIIPPTVIGSLSAVKIGSDIMLHRAPEAIEIPADLKPPKTEFRKPVAIIYAGAEGTQVLELLGAYGLLAQSGKFTTYIVSAQKRLLATTGALAVYPHLSLEEAPVADVVVLPSSFDTLDPKARGALRGLLNQARFVLAIGEGSRIPAEFDLLTEATSHILSIDAFEKTFPKVKWVRDQRIVKSGKIITTGGGFAGLEGTLEIIEQFSPGSTRTHWLRSLRISEEPIRESMGALRTFQLLMRAAFDWLRKDISVWITDGTDELSLGFLLDLPPRTFHERVITVSDHRALLKTRFGAWIVPTIATASAPVLSQLIEAPGSVTPQSSLAKMWFDAHQGGEIRLWNDFTSEMLLSQLLDFISTTSGVESVGTILTQVEYPGTKPSTSFLTRHFLELLIRALILSGAGMLIVRWYLRRRTRR